MRTNTIAAALAVAVATTSATTAEHAAPASTGRRSLCRATPTSDLRPAGRWAGECVDGRAQGRGAMRVDDPDGRGVFSGVARNGRPFAGVTMFDDGALEPLAPAVERVPEYMDAAAAADDRAYQAAYAGAIAASQAYDAAGNPSSARWYRELRRKLERTRPE